MAASDSTRMGDLLPWWNLSAPGCTYPQSMQVQQDQHGLTSLDQLAGPLPWGCEQPEPGPQEQV